MIGPERDPYAGLSEVDRARARVSDQEAARIAQKRRDMARQLLAPPGPAEAVKAAWKPRLDGSSRGGTAGGNQ